MDYHLFKESVKSKSKLVHRWYYYYIDTVTGKKVQRVCFLVVMSGKDAGYNYSDHTAKQAGFQCFSTFQASCAKLYHTDLIVTRNIKDFANSPVKPVTPQEFVSL